MHQSPNSSAILSGAGTNMTTGSGGCESPAYALIGIAAARGLPVLKRALCWEMSERNTAGIRVHRRARGNTWWTEYLIRMGELKT
jgi:hypothetical protein